VPGNLYPYTAALSGSFVKSTGGAPSICTVTTQPFCVKLEVQTNGNTVNLVGSETLASVSVPPIVTLSGGFPSNLSDSEDITCGTLGVEGSCQPTFKVTLTAKGNTGDKLTLPGSAVTGGATVPSHLGGVVELCLAFGLEIGCGNSFVAFTATAQSLKAVPKAPREGIVLTGRTTTLGFELHRPTATEPVDALEMIALGDFGVPVDADEESSTRSFLSFVPLDLKPKDLKTLIYDYDFVVDAQNADCNGSFFVEIELVDRTPPPRSLFAPGGKLVLPLGDAPDYTNGCGSDVWSGVNLVTDPTRRVDETGVLFGKCCNTLAGALQRINGADGWFIKSVSLVLEGLSGVNQKALVRRAQVNNFVFEPAATTDFVRDCATPRNGRTFRIIKLTGPGAGDRFEVPDEDITSSCQLRGTVDLDGLQPDVPGDTDYFAQLCISGRCLPDGVHFTVRRTD
jgi:hypothetical protein